MEIRSLLSAAMRLIGFLGVGLLAYSAGYTRALIRENTSIIESGAATTRVLFSISRLPAWTGIMAFVGMGLTFLYLGWWIVSSGDGSAGMSR